MKETGYELQKIVILARHGLRIPQYQQIRKDCFHLRKTSYGKLSCKGRALSWMLGKTIKKEIASKLREGISQRGLNPTIRIAANECERTLTTAKYFSKGLYPPKAVRVECSPSLFSSDIHLENPEAATEIKRDIQRNMENIDALIKPVAILNGLLNEQQSIDLKSNELFIENGHGAYIQGSFTAASRKSDALVHWYLMHPFYARSIGNDSIAEISKIVDFHRSALFESYALVHNTARGLMTEIMNEIENSNRVLSYFCGHDSNILSILTLLKAKPMALQETRLGKIPVGCMLMFKVWENRDKEKFISVHLAYQSDRTVMYPCIPNKGHRIQDSRVELCDLESNQDGFYPYDAFMEKLKFEVNMTQAQ